MEVSCFCSKVLSNVNSAQKPLTLVSTNMVKKVIKLHIMDSDKPC